MSVVYGVLTVIALGLVVWQYITDKQNKWMLLVTLSVFFKELGDLLMSVAPTLDFALHANRLNYMGQVMLPIFVLMMTLQFCGYRVSRLNHILLFAIGLVMLTITLTQGVTDWYYADCWIEVVDGIAFLRRSYGPLHWLYYVYICGFLVVDAVVLVRFRRRKQENVPYQGILLAVVFYLNAFVWLLEYSMPRNFELLTVSYILTVVFLMMMGRMFRALEGQHQQALSAALSEVELAREELSRLRESLDHENDSGEPNTAQTDWSQVLDEAVEAFAFTQREEEVFRLLCEGMKRDDIAQKLFLSSNTVKKYISAIYRKMDVNSRSELFVRLRNGEYK